MLIAQEDQSWPNIINFISRINVPMGSAVATLDHV